MTKNLWATALAAAFAATAVAIPRAEIIEQVIVKVNGEIITKTEFEQRQVLALRARKIDPDPKSDELKKAIAEITPQLIVDAIDELILLQHGRETRLQAVRRAVYAGGLADSQGQPPRYRGGVPRCAQE